MPMAITFANSPPEQSTFTADARAFLMAELSAYEAKRRRRIEENRAALLALQIDRLPAPKRQRRDAPSKPAQPVARRQSARLQELKTLTPEDIDRARRLEKRERLGERQTSRPSVSKTRKPRPVNLFELPELDVRVNERVGRQGPAMPIRELDVDVEHFHDLWLGKQIVPPGKNPVMQGIVSAGVETGTAPIAVFSQMNGAQLFRNAIALFVNVDQNTSYDNVFQEADADGGRVVFFRWFAPMLSSLQTVAVQRLLRVRRGDARFFLDGSEESSEVESSGDTADDQEHEEPAEEPLLLFIRQTRSPYVYCGRLGFLGIRPEVRPLEFRWQLLDADAIDWTSIRRQLIDSLSS